MKKLLTLLLLAFVLPFYSFSQNHMIGYSKSQVLNETSAEPCKSTFNDIWYCIDNGNMINYSLKNNLVSSVLYMSKFNSLNEAYNDVKSEILRMESIYGRPTMKGEQAYWFSGDLLFMVAYGLSNGKHYSSLRVSER